jgi:hemoglobin
MHEHIPIRLQDAEAWLTCMDMALENCDLSGPAVARIQATFRKVALSLVNVQA